jgi:hypothetical protein
MSWTSWKEYAEHDASHNGYQSFDLRSSVLASIISVLRGITDDKQPLPARKTSYFPHV